MSQASVSALSGTFPLHFFVTDGQNGQMGVIFQEQNPQIFYALQMKICTKPSSLCVVCVLVQGCNIACVDILDYSAPVFSGA